MGVINVLDKHTAELIAAGEVVERPAAIIKELLENSIDAKATAITVEIQNGGVKYIRITDNGNGFYSDDVPKAFLRHATSKVKESNDLDAISTLGFRGEALASICAVAKVELLTCAKDENIGTRYIIEGGEEKLYEEAGCPKGSTIIIRDVFYNVPARMKFLKRDITEANAVANVIDKIALSHPEISFTFIRDGKQALKTTGDNKLKSAIYSVCGREFANGLLEVDYSLNNVAVSGYVSKPQYARPNRNMQIFFLNGRYVKSSTAMAAVAESSKGQVMVSKHSACILHINIPENTVDVNVHPAKIEVRFVNEKPIFDAVYYAVKNTFLQKDRIKEMDLNIWQNGRPKANNAFSMQKTPYDAKPEYKDITIQEATQETNKTELNNNNKITTENKFMSYASKIVEDKMQDEPIITIPTANYNNTLVSDSINVYEAYRKNTVNNDVTKIIDNKTSKVYASKEINNSVIIADDIVEDSIINNIEKEELIPQKKQNYLENSAVTLESEYNTRYIGEAFSTYIIVQRDNNEIVLIDKHAAHEKIIYEKLKAEKGQGYAQMLLSPLPVTLPKLEYDAIINNEKVLSDSGFEISDFGNGTVLVRSAPQYLENVDIEQNIIEIAGYLLKNKNDFSTDNMDWVYHSVACRAAIKAGNISKHQELIEIALKLAKEDNLRYCPHGRPISIILTKRELEKQFGRI